LAAGRWRGPGRPWEAALAPNPSPRPHPPLEPTPQTGCTPDGAGITYNANINVALAVAMPDGGLITPVLKSADATDIYQLSRNWADLVKRARRAAQRRRRRGAGRGRRAGGGGA
jgi:hypothetical protein